MDKKSFLASLIIIALYLAYSLNRFEFKTKEYKAESFINIDKKSLLIEKKPPVISKVFDEYSFWGVRKEEAKSVKKEKKETKKKVKKVKDIIELKSKDGIYNLCIKDKCYEILGIGKGFVVLFRKEKDNYLYFKKRKGDLIDKRVKVVKITSNKVKFLDLKSKKEIEADFFRVEMDKYKPKEKK